MRRLDVRNLRACFAGALAVVVCGIGFVGAGETALDRYIAKPDPTYSWKVVTTHEGNGATEYVVDLKSQTWRTTQDVDRVVWQHWVTIIKPAKPASNIAYLYIQGGSNGGEPPKGADALTRSIALATNSIVVDLKMVPNQPLIFHHDGVQRKEDDLIGYTHDQFLKTGDETWPARLPMTKSAVRAMDCVQELMASEQGGKFKVEKFVVSGGSKRGWTTWCTAAVDKRVAAFIPISIDVVNTAVSMRHHVAVYGFYTYSVGDYYRHKIVQRANDPRMKLLHDIEDPYSYRDRYTMPKFIVAGSGDQYFCPDSSQFYYDDLPGEKLLRYVPNADHGLGGSDARESIVAYFYTVVNNKPRPKYSWTFERDGSIQVKTADSPKAVTLWQATNPEARDFRVETLGRKFKPTQLTDAGGGVFVAKIAEPKKGWTASFVELTYDVGAPVPLKVTTSVRVTPDTLPHQDVDATTAPYEAQVHPKRPRAKRPS